MKREGRERKKGKWEKSEGKKKARGRNEGERVGMRK